MTTARDQISFYEAVGGHSTFETLVDRFYDGVAEDPLLKPMYPEDDLDGARVRLCTFLEQYWGGPKTYGETRGHPRLRMRHAIFPVSPRRGTPGCTTCAWRWTRSSCRRCMRKRCGTTSSAPRIRW